MPTRRAGQGVRYGVFVIIAARLALTVLSACTTSPVVAEPPATPLPSAPPPPSTVVPVPGSSLLGSVPAATATSATDPPAGDLREAEVRSTIQLFWEAWFRAAGNPPDPSDPNLQAVLTGSAWTDISASIDDLANNGRFVRRPDPSQFSSTVLAISFGSDSDALVIECVVDDVQVIDQATNQVIDGDVVTYRVRSTMQKSDDRWRFTTTTAEEIGQGSLPCPH